MQLIGLIIGSVLAILFVVLLFAGKKYDYMTENLKGDEYPLTGIYSVGFVLSSNGPFRLKGKIREMLINQAKLIYDPRYAEYYASVVWAQMLSFGYLSITLGFALAGAMNSAFMILIGIIMAVVFGWYFTNHMNDILSTREFECAAELPEVVSSLALLINAGMMLRKAWFVIAESKEGKIYELMRAACSDMENGVSDVDAIHKFGRMTNSNEVRKFTSALCQSIEHGSSELTLFLNRQCTEMWALKKQLMLQKGEASATKLLMPTVMLFVAIIAAVITGAIGMIF